MDGPLQTEGSGKLDNANNIETTSTSEIEKEPEKEKEHINIPKSTTEENAPATNKSQDNEDNTKDKQQQIENSSNPGRAIPQKAIPKEGLNNKKERNQISNKSNLPYIPIKIKGLQIQALIDIIQDQRWI